MHYSLSHQDISSLTNINTHFPTIFSTIYYFNTIYAYKFDELNTVMQLITPLHGTFLWKMSDLVSDRELLPLEEMAVTALKSQNSISNYTNLYSKWFHVRFVDF